MKLDFQCAIDSGFHVVPAGWDTRIPVLTVTA
jgi:hypothetical protein